MKLATADTTSILYDTNNNLSLSVHVLTMATQILDHNGLAAGVNKSVNTVKGANIIALTS